MRTIYNLQTDLVTARISTFLADRHRTPTYQDYFPFDQLHGRGVSATNEHMALAGIQPGMRVLDLGCGIGGSARLLAAKGGCRVVGVDLSPDFVALARELTVRCGLGEQIEYQVGDALALPFAPDSFDHVWCHNVTMNIADKAGLAREIRRVLKPGGRFSCTEEVLGPAGDPIYPLPWARDTSASFLDSAGIWEQTLDAAGLRIVQSLDLTDKAVAAARDFMARYEAGNPPLNANHLVLGEDFPERQLNVVRSILEGRISQQFVLVEKP